MGIFIKNDEQIAIMRQAGRICRDVHELLATYIKPGITTGELNKIAVEYIASQGATPSFLGYRGFPAAICTSVNEHVIHGVPGLRKLKNGDIISIDIGVCLKRFHGDAARSHPVGTVSEKHKRLLEVTKQSFFEAMKHARAGCHLHEMGAAIEEYVTRNGFFVVKDWCGHGIGRIVHEEPSIPHTAQKTRGPRLTPGMTLAIEPMINVGTQELNVHQDTWTVVTKDGKFSAHYEDTVLITTGEPDILTL
ncbi:MAG: type I methionyl aminopeptidase [Defluviitaleaceae bacterium]|nr:type I methionyl aminopeptidase [Defluviitaleaceae bacterium]MCL2238814.1 type I methionyl aminopeptidase [Defluviitaleaceae bacterium]